MSGPACRVKPAAAKNSLVPIPSIYKGKVARPERFELPTFWFVGSRSGESKVLLVLRLPGVHTQDLPLSWDTLGI